MQTSNKPALIPVPFADSGTKNTIPTAASPTPGLASLATGFPPVTMTPIPAGGIPPAGADFNGILNLISAAARWAQAGGIYPYDSAFSTAIGGYPKGAVLANADFTGFWLNAVDNNIANPDTGGANWLPLPNGIATTAEAQAWTNDIHALTPKKLDDAFKGANQSLNASGGSWQRLPGGLIIMTGTALATLSGAPNPLPLAIPNALLGLGLSPVAGAGSTNVVSSITNTATTLTVTSSGSNVNVRYVLFCN